MNMMSEIDQSPTWYVSDGQRQSGPHSFDELAGAIAAGRIPVTSVVWQQGWPQWVPASQFFAGPQIDPLAQLGDTRAAQTTQVNVFIAPPSRRRGAHPLVTAGAILMIIGVPLLCVGGVGALLMLAGFILLIVGACF